MQTSNTKFDALTNTYGTKSVDYLVAITGWPYLFAVANGYTLAALSVGGDDLTQFLGIQKLAGIPRGAASSCKGRPEEGMMTLGTLQIPILDSLLGGLRIATDLTSRQAYLEAASAGFTTTLKTDINATTTTVTLVDGTNFAAQSIAYIGLECLKLGNVGGDKVVNGDGTSTYSNVTRGYRLTTGTPHLGVTAAGLAGVKVYSFMPSLYRRPIVVYKGYQALTSTVDWLRCFVGTITNDSKSGAVVSLTAMSTTWEMYGDSTRKLGRVLVTDPRTASTVGVRHGSTINGPVHPSDTSIIFYFPQNPDYCPPTIGSGYFMLRVQDELMGISGLDPADLGAGNAIRQFKVVRGVGGTQPMDTFDPGVNDNTNSGTIPVQLLFSNINWGVIPPVGTEPIKLILQLLTSVNGDGANGTYDIFPKGVGLGIPQDKIDVTSFTNILAHSDYDSNQRVFCVFDEPVTAIDFIEAELCKPFGWYLRTGNDGKISLIRPKNRTSFFISGVNNKLYFRRNSVSTDLYQTTIATGVYRPTEMAAVIQNSLAATGFNGWVVTWNSSTRKFRIQNASAFDFAVAGIQNIRATIGFTGQQLATMDANSDTAVAVEVTNTLSENDLWDVQAIPNRAQQIATVTFKSNWDYIKHKFTAETYYIDAETVNLGDTLGERNYEIDSKCLLALQINNIGGHGSHIGLGWLKPDTYFGVPIGTYGRCGLVGHPPAPTYGYDTLDSWASLYSLMLLDRYKNPPMMFKCKMLWRYNLAELGDVFRISHSSAGLMVDRERASPMLTARNFELVALNPTFDGYLEATFLAFREYPL